MRKYNGSYKIAVASVFHELKTNGAEVDSVQNEVDVVFEEKIIANPVKRGRGKSNFNLGFHTVGVVETPPFFYLSST